MHTAGGAMSNMSTMTNEMETLGTVDLANSQPWFHVCDKTKNCWPMNRQFVNARILPATLL